MQEHNGRVRLVFGEGTTFMTRMTLSEFTAALHEAGGCYLSVVDAGTVLCQPLAEKPDAGSELFLSRDRNENICTCTAVYLLVLVGLSAMLAELISPALS